MRKWRHNILATFEKFFFHQCQPSTLPYLDSIFPLSLLFLILGLPLVIVDGYLGEVGGVEEQVDPLDADREAQGLREGGRHQEHGQSAIVQ